MTPTQTQYDKVLAISATLNDVDIYDAHHGKTHDAVRVRRIAWYVLADHLGWTHSAISRHCKFDRVTILIGVDTIAKMSSHSNEASIIQAILKSLDC